MNNDYVLMIDYVNACLEELNEAVRELSKDRFPPVELPKDNLPEVRFRDFSVRVSLSESRARIESEDVTGMDARLVVDLLRCDASEVEEFGKSILDAAGKVRMMARELDKESEEKRKRNEEPLRRMKRFLAMRGMKGAK